MDPIKYLPFSMIIFLLKTENWLIRNQIIDSSAHVHALRVHSILVKICHSLSICLLFASCINSFFLFMDSDLYRAVAQFGGLPGGGGLSGGSFIPPEGGGPSGSYFHEELALNENKNQEILDSDTIDTLQPDPSYSYEFLMSDDERKTELMELLQRLDKHPNKHFHTQLDVFDKQRLISIQLKLEKALERALVEKGFTPESILASRYQWRNAAFKKTTQTDFISARTLAKTLNVYKNNIAESQNFHRILNGIHNGVIQLIKKD